jgi:hypothetical protein
MKKRGNETVFGGVVRRLNGDLRMRPNGKPELPEYALFNSNYFGVGAVLDPFSPGDLGVVVFDHNGTPGRQSLLAKMPIARRLGLDLVRANVEQVMLEALGDQGVDGVRPIGRHDGFEVPDDAHYVSYAARRGQQRREGRVPEAELQAWYAQLKFNSERQYQTRLGLGALMLTADVINGLTPDLVRDMSIDQVVQGSIAYDALPVVGSPVSPYTPIY